MQLQAQQTMTLLIDFPCFIRSNGLLICASGMVWMNYRVNLWYASTRLRTSLAWTPMLMPMPDISQTKGRGFAAPLDTTA
jgi:hypothetical protein